MLATVTFNKDASMSNVQFARQFWIPAGSMRDIYIPVRAPNYSTDSKSIDAQVQLLDTRGNSDVFLSRDVSLYRTVTTSQINVKIFAPQSASGYDLTGSLREQLGTSSTYLNLKAEDIPQDASLMENISVILLGHDDMQLGPLQMQAMRQWILAGGQLIVILPETGMTFCQTLLGDHLPMSLVTATSLNEAKIDGSNILTDGSMNAKVSNKVNQPRGWDLGKLNENRVDINGGGARFRNSGSNQSTLISSTIDLSAQWATVKVQGKFRVEKNNQASGAVFRGVFLDNAKLPIGKPIDLISSVSTRATDYSKELSIPNGATTLKLEVGMEEVNGTLWAMGCQVTPTSMRFETPVPFWRIFAPGTQTSDNLMADGWPMMVRSKMGRGQVTILTMGSAYWTAMSKAGSRIIDDAFRTTSSFRTRNPVDDEQLAQAGTQQIGYEVLSRQPVMISLLVMLGLMVLAGLVFWKKGNPEMLAPLSVVLALIVAGVIWGLGISHHRQTPLTVASIQLAQIDPVANYAITNAVVSTYSPTRLQSPLKAVNGGVIWPDISGSTGKILRMNWTDCNQWQWENFELPEATLRTHAIARVMPLDQPVKAVASFNRQGMICTIESGPYAGVDHPIIASLNNHAVGKLDGHNTFNIIPDPTLGLDQFVTSSTMTALDIQRQDIYRSLIYPDSDALNIIAFPTVPSAMWWARAMDMGFTQGSQDARQRQYALVCVPLTYTRPAPGTTFIIPSPVLQTDIFREDSTRAMSTVLNPMTGRWTSTISTETKFQLAFMVPTDLLPLKIEDGILDIDFKTPGRSLIVTTTQGDEISRKRDLANRVQIPVKGDQLSINRQGQIVLNFEVTPHDDPMSSHMWDASGGVRLQITAVTE